jgi:membrane associated rhomboid family serine protease
MNVVVGMLNKINYNSPVILTYALISLAVLGLNAFTGGASNWHFFTLRPTSVFDPLMYLRMFTCVLGHANWGHYVSNFMIILLIGPAMEERYGSKVLLKMITATAFITGVVHSILGMHVIGASGIAFMLILLASVTNLKKGKIPLTLVLILIIYMGREVHNSIVISANVSYIGHIIGGLCGAVLGFFANKSGVETHEETH